MVRKQNWRVEIPITGKLRQLQRTNYLKFVKVYAKMTKELREEQTRIKLKCGKSCS